MQKITQKPWLYKTELCKSFSTTGKCSYGARCQYAHGQAQLRPVTRHPKYKSRRCKNFDLGSCSYGSRCCFIHSTDQQKGKSTGHRSRKHHKSKKGSRKKNSRSRNGSKDKDKEKEKDKDKDKDKDHRGVTRLQQRNMRNRAVELEATEEPPVAAAPKQYKSLQLVSQWSPAPVKPSQPVVSPRTAESLPNIRSSSPYHPRKEPKPQAFLDSHVKAILEGIGIMSPVVANPNPYEGLMSPVLANPNPFGIKPIVEVGEEAYSYDASLQSDSYRSKGNLLEPDSYRSKGNLLESDSFRSKGNLLEPDSYRSKGNLLEPDSFRSKGNLLEPDSFRSKGNLLEADPYRPKGNLLAPVHPEKSIVAESPEAPSWEEKNRGRLSVFKNIGNKSRSCRW